MNGDSNEERFYGVASETIGVRVQRAVDPEIAALLDDSDASRFGSDIEDLDEDFVIQANLPKDKEDVSDKRFNLCEQSETKDVIDEDKTVGHQLIVADSSSPDGVGYHVREVTNDSAVENTRVRRLLDEQFDVVSPF